MIMNQGTGDSWMDRLRRSKLARAVSFYQSKGFWSLLAAVQKTIFRESYTAIYLYWLLNGKRLSRDDGYYTLQDRSHSNRFYFPQLRFHYLATPSAQKDISLKYFDDEEVTIESGDVVVDIGGFIGVTSSLAAQKAERVIALEPSPRNLFCLQKNCDQENIEAHQLAAWNEPSEMKLNLGTGASNESLIRPDDGGTGQSVTVDVDTLESIASDLDIDRIDFLKVEAEGAEPEILQGIGDLEVSKLVVNCSEERDGESPAEEVKSILNEQGYSIKEDMDGQIIRAKY